MDNGILEWEISSGEGKLMEVPLSVIKTDRVKLQTRTKPLHQETVRRYRNLYKAGVDMPPLVVGYKDGEFQLIDGYHRYEALLLSFVRNSFEADVAKRLGKLVRNIPVKVLVVSCQNDAQAVLWSLKKNAEHGRPLSLEDRKKAFKAWLDEEMYWQNKRKKIFKSWRQVSREFGGTDPKTLRGWCKEMNPKLLKMMATKNTHYKGCVHEYDAEEERLNMYKSMLQQIEKSIKDEFKDAEKLQELREQIEGLAVMIDKKLKGEEASIIEETEDY